MLIERVLVINVEAYYFDSTVFVIENFEFDLYDLTKAERDAIGFIEIK